ncbi:MAG: PKD domain-containing protein, partial [Thermoanaerobaculia bacterium]
ITFNATSYANYDFSCSNHNYSWDFGDGSAAGTGKSPAHTFTGSGPHTVTVTISNTTQTNFKRTLVVTTNDGGTSGGSCGTIIPNVSLSINYHDPADTCGQLVQCDAKQPLSFTILQYGAYDIGCATHTYDWDFGDGSAHSTIKEPVHTYQAGGLYPAKCIVSNGTQTVPLSWNVDIKAGIPGGVPVVVGMTVAPLVGVANGYMFTPKFDHPELVTRWTWDFGDNSGLATGRGTAANPIPEAHIYADNRPHTVTLTAYNGNSAVGAVNRNPAAKRRAVKH